MEIKGTALAAIRDFVKSNHIDRYEEWLDSLPDTAKEFYSGVIDATKWYPLQEGGVIPTMKIGELFFDGDMEKCAWVAGRFSAEKALTGIYKIFVKAASPGYLIERASRIFTTYYQPCEMEVTEKGTGHAYMVIRKMEMSHEVIEYRIAGWVQKALEISGAKDVEVKFPKSKARGDSTTEIDINWS